MMEDLYKLKEQLAKLGEDEKVQRDLYLKSFYDGDVSGPMTGYPSIDKPWLKWYKKENLKTKVKNQSIFRYLEDCAKNFPQANLLNYYGKKYNIQDLKNKVQSYINDYVNKLNLKKGDAISLLMMNTPDALFLIWAFTQVGIIVNMIRFDESSERIAYMNKKANSKYMFISNLPFLIEKSIKSLELYDLGNVITIDLTSELPLNKIIKMLQLETEVMYKSTHSTTDEETVFPAKYLSTSRKILFDQIQAKKQMKKQVKDNAKIITFEQLRKSKKINNLVAEDTQCQDRTAVIVYTGGTTGNPKGVEITVGNLNHVSYAMENVDERYVQGKSVLNILPPAIAFYLNATHSHMCTGMTVELIPAFSPDSYAYYIAKIKPNFFMSGPVLFEKMINSNAITNGKYIESAASGGDKLQPEEEKRMNDYLKSINSKGYVTQGYGMSECTAGVTYTKPGTQRIGSVGIPIINATVSVFDYKTDNELKINEVGEICINGPTLMKGYLDDVESTNSTLIRHSDGSIWLHTDDFGKIDEDGRVTIIGRVKRMITRFGAKVWLSEIEDEILKNKEISNCCVVKMHDEVEREVPVAHIVFDKEISEELVEKIDSEIKAKLGENSVPKYYVIRDEIPYTEVNKKKNVKALEEEDIFDSSYSLSGKIIKKVKMS